MSAIDIGFQKEILSGPDSVVIRNHEDGIKGGKVLDMTGFTPDVLKTGHVIIKSNTDVYKPMPLNGDVYGSLPANHSYVGICMTTTEWRKEGSLVGIMTAGEINDVAAPYDFSTIAAAFKSAVPTIRFDHD